ncbi:MAG: penicillin-binding transpeptidase domain-containing protein, partial [Vicinamibacteria bacterium]|nr:penicillin-binding transpeptidase domain-containing protein [Vicinamibacteria bacterium]
TVRVRVPRSGGRVLRGLLALVLAAVAAGSWFAVARTRDTLELQAALAALARGEAALAREALAAHVDCDRHEGTARAGVALASAWLGEGPAPTPAAADLRAAGVLLLFQRGLHARTPESLERVAALGVAAGEPLAAAFLLAAQVERPDEVAAAGTLARHHAAIAAVGLGREATRVLGLRQAGALAIVRDRRGRALGTVGADAFFRPEPELDPRLLQPPFEAAAARFGPGLGLRLSIDLDLSRLALRALGGARGSVVLLDPESGHVLAAVSDERTLRREPAAAFEQRREPASISKLVTSAAGLRAGHDIDAEIAAMTCRGHETYTGGTLWCSFPGGRMGGLAHAMAISCNTVFANLGVRLGRAAVLAELARWGFQPGEAGAEVGRVLHAEGNDRQLADLSIGLTDTDITPLHAARFAAVLAHGAMPESALIAARDGLLGASPEPIGHAPARPVLEDPAWVELLRRGLAGVTERGGTASGVAPPRFPVAMKTGTASQWGVGYHCNYVGVGPLPHPRIAFAVRVTHGSNSGRAAQAAREVTRRLLHALENAPR